MNSYRGAANWAGPARNYGGVTGGDQGFRLVPREHNSLEQPESPVTPGLPGVSRRSERRQRGLEVWRRHRCGAAHRTARTFMLCAIPRAAWVAGDGPFAVVAWCRTPTVTLWSSLAEAEQALAQIDASACGGRCERRHEIALVDYLREAA